MEFRYLRWCGYRDLNPDGCPYAPQTYASACSAITAYSRQLYYDNMIARRLSTIFSRFTENYFNALFLLTFFRVCTTIKEVIFLARGGL